MVSGAGEFLIGYCKDGDYGVMVENNAEQIAAFIMKHNYKDSILTNFLDVTEIEVSFGFIQYCRDQEFLRLELIPTLAPMQMGEVEPPEFVPFEVEEEDEDENDEELIYLYLHPDVYDTGELTIIGSEGKSDFDPVSIDDLRHDMYKEKRLLALGAHPEGMLCPWEGRLAVAEGVCSWNEEKEDYELIKKEISIDNGNSFVSPEEAVERMDWEVIVSFMDDEVREEVHSELAPCTNLEFLSRYLELAKEDLIIG